MLSAELTVSSSMADKNHEANRKMNVSSRVQSIYEHETYNQIVGIKEISSIRLQVIWVSFSFSVIHLFLGFFLSKKIFHTKGVRHHVNVSSP